MCWLTFIMMRKVSVTAKKTNLDGDGDGDDDETMMRKK
jgi:hypothetical protein